MLQARRENLRVPRAPRKKRDSQSVRFAEQRVSLHRATLAGAEVEELLLDKARIFNRLCAEVVDP